MRRVEKASVKEKKKKKKRETETEKSRKECPRGTIKTMTCKVHDEQIQIYIIVKYIM